MLKLNDLSSTELISENLPSGRDAGVQPCYQAATAHPRLYQVSQRPCDDIHLNLKTRFPECFKSERDKLPDVPHAELVYL